MLQSRNHTDAAAQREFLALEPHEQLLEIWLNGRETNGALADVRLEFDAFKLQVDKEDRPMLRRHDRIIGIALGILAVMVMAAPFITWGFDGLRNLWR